MFVLDSSLVTLQSFDGDPLFSLIQEFRSHGGIGHEDTNHNTPHATEGADDDEFVSPRREGAFDVAYGVPEEAT